MWWKQASIQFPNSSQRLIQEDELNQLKGNLNPIQYDLKGKIYNRIPYEDSEEKKHNIIPGTLSWGYKGGMDFRKFDTYFNKTAFVYLPSLTPVCSFTKLPPFSLYQIDCYFRIEQLDPKIEDESFPLWIPLNSRERKVFYARGEEDCLYQYSLVPLDDRETI